MVLQLPTHSQLLASTALLLCDMFNTAASQASAGSEAEELLQENMEAVIVLKARNCSRPLGGQV